MTQADRSIPYKRFFELSPDLLCVIGFDGRLLDTNPAWEEVTGFPTEDLLTKTFFDLTHPEDREAASFALGEMRDGREESTFEARLLGKDGRYRALAWRASRSAEEEAIIAVARDVTTQNASLRQFKALVDAAPDFIVMKTLESKVFYVNPAGLELIGRSGESPNSLTMADLMPADVLKQFREQHYERVMKEGLWAGETVFKHKDGTTIPVWRTILLIRDETGAPEALGTIARDLRSRKREEAHVRRLKALMDSTSDYVALATLDGDMVYVNPSGMAMVGRIGQDAGLLRVNDFHPPAEGARYERDILPIVLKQGLWAGERTLQHINGSEIPVSQVLMLIRDPSGAPDVIGTIARDLTEQKILESAMRQAIRALSTPIIQVWEGVLALPVIGLVDSPRAAQMMESLLDAIVRTRCRVAILDLTGVDAIDTSTVNHLFKMVQAAALLGSRCVVSGISSGVAQTIAHLGLDFSGMLAFGTLQEALRYAMRTAAGEADDRR